MSILKKGVSVWVVKSEGQTYSIEANGWKVSGKGRLTFYNDRDLTNAIAVFKTYDHVYKSGATSLDKNQECEQHVSDPRDGISDLEV